MLCFMQQAFFQQHDCVSKDAQQKYKSRAANLYKDKLLSMAQNAMRLYGTTLHIDKEALKAAEPEKPPQDFWTQQEEKKESDSSTKQQENNKADVDLLEEHYQPTSYGENAPSLESATAKRADTGAYKSQINTKKAATKKEA